MTTVVLGFERLWTLIVVALSDCVLGTAVVTLGRVWKFHGRRRFVTYEGL